MKGKTVPAKWDSPFYNIYSIIKSRTWEAKKGF